MLVIGSGSSALHFLLSLHLLCRSSSPSSRLDVVVAECGDALGGKAMNEEWPHVRMFSEWRHNVDQRAVEYFEGEKAELITSEDVRPTGREYLDEYVRPLYDSIIGSSSAHGMTVKVMLNTKVLSLSKDPSKIHLGKQRSESMFRSLVVDCASGEEREMFHTHVVDCSGVTFSDSYVGLGGAPAINEIKCREKDFFRFTIPSSSACEEHETARSIVVVGSGYSAATTVLNLMSMGGKFKVTWMVRGSYKPIVGDSLPAREELVSRANEVLSGKRRGPGGANENGDNVEVVKGAVIRSVTSLTQGSGGSLSYTTSSSSASASSAKSVKFDLLYCNCGGKPDLSLSRELQVHLCYATEGPMSLAASLAGASSGDCMKQGTPSGNTLVTSEGRYYVLGGKSYARGGGYLIKVGIGQGRGVADKVFL